MLLGALLASSPASPATPPSRAEINEKKDDLNELREQIHSLRKEISSGENKRAGAADQLKTIEQDISTTQRTLHELTTQKNKVEDNLSDLTNQSHELETRLHGQQQQLERLLYRQYLQSNPDSLRLLLNGNDPNQVTRNLYYLSTIGRARSELLHEIRQSLAQKKALLENTKTRAEELIEIEKRQKEQHAKLVTQREQRKNLLSSLSAKLSEQRKEIGNLRRDEKRLSQLIDRLTKLSAAKPAPRKEPPQSAPPERTKPQAKLAPDIQNDTVPQPGPAGNFARLKGELRLPARGAVSNRFGTPRQEGSTWRGLFIRAGTGGDVKAIAAGRVVFSEWMRGFGNLLIVDHGNSFLSIYGNNDALFKHVGDEVRGGDTIAAVGNSGGNPESGLYFEIRHQGKPVDPMQWVRLK